MKSFKTGKILKNDYDKNKNFLTTQNDMRKNVFKNANGFRHIIECSWIRELPGVYM